jgi:tetratricopeptide (TPR) repeat protein
MRDLDRANSYYDEAIRLQPSFALAYNNRGDARLGKANVPGAFSDFDTAIKLDPTLAIAYGNRGDVF